MGLGVLCVQRYRAGKQAETQEGLMLQTESKGGLDDSGLAQSLPSEDLGNREFIIALMLHNFKRPVCLAFPLFLLLVCCYICGKNSCAMF